MTKMRFKAAEPFEQPEQPSLGLQNQIQAFAKENNAVYAEGHPNFVENFSCVPTVWDFIDQDGGKELALAAVTFSYDSIYDETRQEVTISVDDIRHIVLALQGAAQRANFINKKIEQSSVLTLG
jgi:hypothetical protein